MVSLTIDQPDTEDPDEQRRLNVRQADQLLSLTNRLLRGYRAITRDSTITELSRAARALFGSEVDSEGADSTAWESELTYQADPPKKLAQRSQTITKRVSELFASGTEPEVADLFLLDAEQALHEGRFREAVLFCWSTIDSTFNRKYDELVDAKLAGRMGRSPGFLQGCGLRLEEEDERRFIPCQRSLPVPRIGRTLAAALNQLQ